MRARFLLVCGWLAVALVAAEARGQSWTNITPYPKALSLKKILMVNSSRAYGIDRWDYKIHRTLDGGHSWDTQSVGYDYLNDLFFIDDQTGWAVGSDGQVYRTVDGQHWAVQNSTVSDSLNAVFFLDAQTGWAVGDTGTLITTVNGGQTWVEDAIGSSENLLGIFFLDSDHGWIVGRNQALFTDDGGTNWYFSTTHPSTTYPAYEVLFFDALNGLASVGSLEPDACTGGQDRVWRTSDGGANWSEVHTTARKVLDLDLTGTGSARIVTQDGSVWTTADYGQTWDPQPDLFDFDGTDILDMLDASTGLLAGQSGTVMATSDGGASWVRLGTGTSDTIYDMAFLDAQHGWLITSNEAYETSDGGEHWTVTSLHTDFCWFKQSGEEINPQFVEVLPDDSVLIVAYFDDWDTSSGILSYKSVDGGQSFQEFRDYSNYFFLNDGHFPTASHGYGVGSTGEIWKSTDGGIAWNEQTSPAPQTLYGVHFVSELEGWAVGGMGTILHTANGGTLWSPQSSVGNVLYGVFMADATTGWAVGDYGSIFHTQNGTNWSSQFSSGMTSFYAVKCASASTCWVAGGSGNIYTTSNGGDLWTQQAIGMTTSVLRTLVLVGSGLVYAGGASGTVLKYSGGTDPVADAGQNQSVNEGSPVSLDGSGSYDPGSLPLSYLWEQQSGTSVSILNDDQETASFVAPTVCAQEVLVFRLTVDNQTASDWDETSVTVLDSNNQAPLAQIAPLSPVNENTPVFLDGSASSDDCGITSWLWDQTGGTNVDLQNTTTSMAQFLSPSVCAPEDLTFTLTVSDGSQQDQEQIVVTVQDSQNEPPTADAGTDLVVSEGASVVLNGGASSDDCGIDSYSWSQLDGPGVSLSTPGLATCGFQAPPVCGTEILTFQLTVSDSLLSDDDTVQVTVQNPDNAAPTADAGQDQNVDEAQTVTLDGSFSADDCGIISYLWEQLSGTSVTLQTPNAVSCQFVAPPVCTGEDLIFRLTVDDGTQTASDMVVISVANVSQLPPSADAGLDFDADEQSQVQLNGSNSHADCGNLTYAWEQLGGTGVTLSAADTATPSFDAPDVCGQEVLVFRLTVTDDQSASDQDEVAVTILDAVNATPVADAGPDQEVNEGATVELDGNGSSDDCGPLQFSWTQLAGPTITLEGAATPTPSFLAPDVTQQATVVIGLTVSDGIQESSDQVAVEVYDESVQFPPVITESANLQATMGLAYIYDTDGRAEATGNPPFTWSVTQGPTDFHIDAQTGAVGWIPGVAGEETITIRAENPYGSDEYTFVVNVVSDDYPPPMAYIYSDPNPPEGVAPFAVSFDGSRSISSAEIVSYKWYLGDGSPVEFGPNVAHIYLRPGGYTARLVVTDALGRTGAAQASVTVLEESSGPRPPTARIVASATEGADQLTVDFSCDCQEGDAQILAWLWDFGDDSISNQEEVTHPFTVGRYRVWLTALDANGLAAYDFVDITVSEGELMPPRVEAGADPPSGDAPLSVRFIGLAADLDGEIVERGWDFGDGNTAVGDRAEHQYTQAGNYLASFYAVDNDGLRSSAAIEIQVLSNGLTAPMIISVPEQSATAGQPYAYDSDGRPSARGSPTLTWSLEAAPADMSITASTGELTWTPTEDQVGDQQVTLRVENDAGSDVQEFTVTVSASGIEPPTDDGCGCGLRPTRSRPTRMLWLPLLLWLIILRRRP